MTLRLIMASRGALRVRITRRRQDAEDRQRIDPHEQPERPSVGHEADARSERRRAGCGPPYKAAVLLSRPPFGLHHGGRARARSVGATASCGIGRPRGIEGPGPWPRLHRFPEPRALGKVCQISWQNVSVAVHCWPPESPRQPLGKTEISAEGKGFEPLVPLRVRRFSKPLPSTTRPPLLKR